MTGTARHHWRFGLVKTEDGAAIHEIHIENGKEIGRTENPVRLEVFAEGLRDGESLLDSIVWHLKSILNDINEYGLEE